jgi:hypothetical protein
MPKPTTIHGIGIALLALMTGACFQESVTLQLPCTADDQCGDGQVCDSVALQCVSVANESQTSESTSDGTSGGSTTGDACAPEGSQRCEPEGVDFQICTDGFWLNYDCDAQCMDANMPPGKQAGACVGGTESPTCLCADSIGGQCEGNEPASCTEAGLLQFCQQGRLFGLLCETSCADDGYPVGGPCIPEAQGQGSASCQCADGDGGTCTITEQFVEDCASATVHRRCVDETWWLTDCEQECMRQNMSGGSCEDTGGGNFECICA